MSDIKVSVIIPVYGTREWLPYCLDSVLGQTLSDIEVICVDDASTDGCAGILEEYAARDERVRIITMAKNSGQGICRNAGLDAARGEYVYLLDSDDMISSGALEKLCRIADEDDLDGVLFNMTAIYESEEIKRTITEKPGESGTGYPEGVVRGEELFNIYMDNGEWVCYVQKQLWRRDFIDRERIRFTPRHEHEDEVFAFEALVSAERVRYIPDKLFIRRWRRGSVMTTPPGPANFYGYFKGLLELMEFCDERGLASRQIDRNNARMYEKMTRLYPVLSEEYDLSELISPEDMPVYRLFTAAQKAYLHFGDIPDEVIDKARAAKHVFIYGAGVKGTQAFESLVRAGLAIDAFLVTDPKDAGKAVKGRPVIAIEEADIPEGSLILVAAGEGYRREIERTLDEIGYEYIFYRGSKR